MSKERTKSAKVAYLNQPVNWEQEDNCDYNCPKAIDDIASSLF